MKTILQGLKTNGFYSFSDLWASNEGMGHFKPLNRCGKTRIDLSSKMSDSARYVLQWKKGAYVNSIQHWLCKWRQPVLLRREGSKEERHSRVLTPRCWDERLWHSTQCSTTTENVVWLEKLDGADCLSLLRNQHGLNVVSARGIRYENE